MEGFWIGGEFPGREGVARRPAVANDGGEQLGDFAHRDRRQKTTIRDPITFGPKLSTRQQSVNGSGFLVTAGVAFINEILRRASTAFCECHPSGYPGNTFGNNI